MDAVLAVSALAMASAVAWADWVMSCCGVGSEAMSQVLDCLIMVRLGKTGEGVGYTNGCILGTVSLIYLKFRHSIPEGMPYHEMALFSWQYVMGCIQVHKIHHGCFSGRKTRKDTTWSVFLSVLKCFSWMSSPA